MKFWIEVSATNGQRTGRIDNVLYWRHTKRLDRAGEIEFALPAADKKADLLANKVRVTCYAIVEGDVTEIGAGVVEELRTEWRASAGATLVVSGGDLLRELAVHRTMHSDTGGIIALENFFDAPDYLIDLATTTYFPAAWTLGGELTTDTAVYLRTWHDSILNGLTTVAQVTGEHFRLGSGRTLTWLGPSSNFANSGILATTHADPVAIESNPDACLITNITQVSDSWDQWNRLYIYGAGEGEDRLDLAAAENWPTGLTDATGLTSTITWSVSPPNIGVSYDGDSEFWYTNRAKSYLENYTRLTADGYLMKAIQFKNIAPLSNTDADLADAADQLLRAGYHYLRTHTTPQQFYRLTVTALKTMVPVGETLRVMARGVYEDDGGRRLWLDLDESLIVLEVEHQIDASGVRTLGLTVATIDRWPETDESAIIGPLMEASAALSLPQLSANLDTVTFEQPVDDDYTAIVHFWLPASVTTVNQVTLRFRVDPLRSTVKTVAGSASSSVEFTLDPHTHDVPAHQHTILLTSGVSPTYPVGFGGAGTAGGLIFNSGAGGNISYPTDGGTGATTSASGGGGTVDTTVDLSSAITTTYGIFEESGANTYAYSDLEFSVNGSAATGTVTAISGASGWYELDLTADLVDAKRRPNQAANYLTIAIKAASKVDKTVRVTGEIERRTSVQSLALV